MPSQPQSPHTRPVSRLSYTALPIQKHASVLGIDSSTLSSPDVLEKCVVLSDVDSTESPVVNGNCITPCTINSVSSPGIDSSCKLSACEGVQETPLSVRNGRKRKHQKRRLHRSSLPLDYSDAVISTSSCEARKRTEECPGDITVKKEPRMPKLLPEPRVEYNPETPLRISIHLPLHGMIDAEEGVVNENVGSSAAVPGEIHSVDLAANSTMPIDLTSRASVQIPQASSASSVKPCSSIGSVSSSVPSPRPVYSPISSISGRSTPDVENEKVCNSRREVAQPSVGIMASFLERFNGMSAESLEFSPSQSLWTHSFAEQLAAANRTSFLAGHNCQVPLLSPVSAAAGYMTKVNCQRTVGNSNQLVSHSSLIPLSSSVMSGRPDSGIMHNTETRDYLAVRPMIAAVDGLNGVFNGNLSNVDRHSVCEVNMEKPLLHTAESLSSKEPLNMNDDGCSGCLTVPGMTFLQNFHIYLANM